MWTCFIQTPHPCASISPDCLSLSYCGPRMKLMALVCSQLTALEMMKSRAHLLTVTRRWSNNLRYPCPGPRVFVRKHLKKASRWDWSRNQNLAACSLPMRRIMRTCLPLKVFAWDPSFIYSSDGQWLRTALSHLITTLVSESPERKRKWGKTQRLKQSRRGSYQPHRGGAMQGTGRHG